jgi:ParB family transcriptional regulator, chromosome partitioning protein
MRDNIQDVAISDIQPDPQNLRKTFDQADLEALAENIVQIGQTDPVQLFVREERGGRTIYDLFDGERRWRAANLRGLKTLRAIVIPRPSDSELLVRKISRMMQTRDYTFQEQVTALESGLRALEIWDRPDEWGNAAAKLGVKPEQLRERMRVLRLSPKLRNSFFDGNLDYTVAQQLGRMDDHRKQEDTAEFIQKYHLSNRFVTAKFATMVIRHPEKPLIEVYDLARKELADSVYAKARLGSEIRKTLQQQINEYIDSLLSIEKSLESGTRDGFFKEAFASQFEKARILGSLVRLKQILEGFLTAADAYSQKTETPTLTTSEPKRLTQGEIIR